MTFFGNIKSGELKLNNSKKFQLFIKKQKDCVVELTVKRISGRRTSIQNSALHLYFTLLAEALNDAGFDMRKVIRKEIDIPWSPLSVKEYLWRPIQKEYLKKESTTKLNKLKDIDKVYDILNRVISERCGVSVPFPSIEEVIRRD